MCATIGEGSLIHHQVGGDAKVGKMGSQKVKQVDKTPSSHSTTMTGVAAAATPVIGAGVGVGVKVAAGAAVTNVALATGGVTTLKIVTVGVGAKVAVGAATVALPLKVAAVSAVGVAAVATGPFVIGGLVGSGATVAIGTVCYVVYTYYFPPKPSPFKEDINKLCEITVKKSENIEKLEATIEAQEVTIGDLKKLVDDLKNISRKEMDDASAKILELNTKLKEATDKLQKYIIPLSTISSDVDRNTSLIVGPIMDDIKKVIDLLTAENGKLLGEHRVLVLRYSSLKEKYKLLEKSTLQQVWEKSEAYKKKLSELAVQKNELGSQVDGERIKNQSLLNRVEENDLKISLLQEKVDKQQVELKEVLERFALEKKELELKLDEERIKNHNLLEMAKEINLIISQLQNADEEVAKMKTVENTLINTIKKEVDNQVDEINKAVRAKGVKEKAKDKKIAEIKAKADKEVTEIKAKAVEDAAKIKTKALKKAINEISARALREAAEIRAKKPAR